MSSADDYQQRMREQHQREEEARFRQHLEDQARRQREQQAREAEARNKSVSKNLGRMGAMPSPFGAPIDQAAYRAGQAETEAWKKMLPGGSKPAESARRPAAKDAGFSGGPTGFNPVAGAGGYVSSGPAYSGRPSRARRKGRSGKVILLLLAGLLLFAFVKLSHQSPSSSDSYPGNAQQLAANSLELATGKDAVTTRSFPDPRGRGPDCGIPEGTQVLIQSVNKQTGEVQLFVLPNGKRDSKRCTNFMTVDWSSLRVIKGYPSPK
jgi:hypothetical protein